MRVSSLVQNLVLYWTIPSGHVWFSPLHSVRRTNSWLVWQHESKPHYQRGIPKHFLWNHVKCFVVIDKLKATVVVRLYSSQWPISRISFSSFMSIIPAMTLRRPLLQWLINGIFLLLLHCWASPFLEQRLTWPNHQAIVFFHPGNEVQSLWKNLVTFSPPLFISSAVILSKPELLLFLSSLIALLTSENNFYFYALALINNVVFFILPHHLLNNCILPLIIFYFGLVVNAFCFYFSSILNLLKSFFRNLCLFLFLCFTVVEFAVTLVEFALSHKEFCIFSFCFVG